MKKNWLTTIAVGTVFAFVIAPMNAMAAEKSAKHAQAKQQAAAKAENQQCNKSCGCKADGKKTA